MRKPTIFSRKFFSTIFTFYCIRVTSALMPIIVIPFASRVLDQHNFSLFMYALSVGIWVSMLVSYGDKLSGIRNVTCQQGQLDKINHIISETLTAQSYLVILSMTILIFVTCLHAVRQERMLLWLAWGYGVAQGLNPLWIFQGMERLKSLACLEFFVNLIIFLLIFFILPHHPQYAVAMVIIICGRFLVNLISYRILYLYSIRIYYALWHRSLYRLKHGFGLFFLVASVSLYTTLSTVILGLFSCLAVVGMFSGVEKLTRGLTAIILSISQAVTPRLYILRHNQDRVDALNKYTTWVAVSIASFVAFILYVYSDQWVNWYLGPMYNKANIVLKIMAWVIPCYVFSTILSSQFLIPTYNDRICNVIYFVGGIIAVGLAILIVPKYGAIGMSSVVLTTELFVLIAMIFAVRMVMARKIVD